MSVLERQYTDGGKRRFIVRFKDGTVRRETAFDRRSDARAFEKAARRYIQLAGVDLPVDDPEFQRKLESAHEEYEARLLAAPYGPGEYSPAPPVLSALTDEQLPAELREAIGWACQVVVDECFSDLANETPNYLASHLPTEDYLRAAVRAILPRFAVTMITVAGRFAEPELPWPRSAAEQLAIHAIITTATFHLEMKGQEVNEDEIEDLLSTLNQGDLDYTILFVEASPPDLKAAEATHGPLGGRYALDYLFAPFEDDLAVHPYLWQPPLAPGAEEDAPESVE